MPIPDRPKRSRREHELWLIDLPVPEPSPGFLDRLLVSVRREWVEGHQAGRGERRSLRTLVALARSQVELPHLEFWAASIFLVSLGCLASFRLNLPQGLSPLAAVAPLVSLLGVRYTLRPARQAGILLAPSFTPGQVALARFMVVVAYDFLLLLAASVALWVAAGPHSAGSSLLAFLLPMTLAWFAPLVLFGAISLSISLLVGVPVGIGLGTLGWLALLPTRTAAPLASLLLAGPGPDSWFEVKVAALLVAGVLLYLSPRWGPAASTAS
ncbi:hypothetical protein [Limnochorda pilosa]|uniref:Uncharacterized protein n=1 Tax=Limnochorda pilosa TaxID=1555112 RepID=A0A0K2SQA4_LIMPI|nr:hypothetical protein [Limnochorda pilosa]BAS29014.1 hypothetical protein LIP_3191 [Limnochorda pilosa]